MEQANDLIQDKWPLHKHHASKLRAYVAQLPIKFIAKPCKCAASPSSDGQNLGEESGAKWPRTAPLLPSTPITSTHEASGAFCIAIVAPHPHAAIFTATSGIPPSSSYLSSLPSDSHPCLPPVPPHPTQSQHLPPHMFAVPSKSQQVCPMSTSLATPLNASQCYLHWPMALTTHPPPPPSTPTLPSHHYSSLPSMPMHNHPPL